MDQQIIFRINKQLFSVSVMKTDRIIHLADVTTMPDTSDYIMGVMEVEGDVLPIIDLPNRLYGQTIENQKETQVLVALWKDRRIGLAVDEVLSVQFFDQSQVDGDTEKVSVIDQSKSPVEHFIRTETGIVLGLDIECLFAEKGTLELEQLMDPELSQVRVAENAD